MFSNKDVELHAKLDGLEALVKEEIALVDSYITLNSKEIDGFIDQVLTGINPIIDKLDDKVTSLKKVLDLHIELATIRYRLENSSLSAYASLKLALNSMAGMDVAPAKVGYGTVSVKEYDSLVRKTKSLLNEFKYLEDKALLDAVVDKINESSLSERKSESKKRIPS